jgi:hypothetical protein
MSWKPPCRQKFIFFSRILAPQLRPPNSRTWRMTTATVRTADHPDSKKLDLMGIGMGLWLFDGPSESDRSQHTSRLGHDSCWYFCLALSGTRTTTRDISSVCAAPGQSDLMQFIRSRANRKNYVNMSLYLQDENCIYRLLCILWLEWSKSTNSVKRTHPVQGAPGSSRGPHPSRTSAHNVEHKT